MKKKLVIIGILVVAALSVVVICSLQADGGPSKPHFLGISCREDSDCAFLTGTTAGGAQLAICANPDSYATFWQEPFDIDPSKECYCGPYGECMSIKPTSFDRLRGVVRRSPFFMRIHALLERLGLIPRRMY